MMKTILAISAIGATLLLGGCVAVPYDSPYPYAYGGGPYYAPYGYAPYGYAPYGYAPSVSFGFGYFGHGGGHGGGHHGH